jgi:hypothetical protein
MTLSLLLPFAALCLGFAPFASPQLPLPPSLYLDIIGHVWPQHSTVASCEFVVLANVCFLPGRSWCWCRNLRMHDGHDAALLPHE